jgi:hypothetical protein
MAFCVPMMILQPSHKKAGTFLMLFLLCVLCLQGLSFLLVGTKAYLTWKPTLELTLNLGPLWYFQMQQFDCFHDFLYIMITGLPYLAICKKVSPHNGHPTGMPSEKKNIKVVMFFYQSCINVDLFIIPLGYFSALMFFINVAINI